MICEGERFSKMQVDSNNYFPKSGVLRIDDISINTDRDELRNILKLISDKYPKMEILLAVSALVFNMNKLSSGNDSQSNQRVFPKILNAFSDHRVFYKVEEIGIPDWLPSFSAEFNCKIASHGLIHVDHRLLDASAQELSILTSASILDTNIFVPPFNKYNPATELICSDNQIKLVKWEDGWIHLAYNGFTDAENKYYLHLHDFNSEQLAGIFS
jgi:hypothetical protein